METSTRAKLLSVAEQLLRTRGYSDFSYADLATQVGVRKPSIHHYFPTKEDLGAEVVVQYISQFVDTLDQIVARKRSASSRLRAYSELFAGAVSGGAIPLCTALAAERDALPGRMQEQTVEFFQLHLAWLERVIADAREGDELPSAPDTKTAAITLLSALEGGAVVGWALSRPDVVRVAFDSVLRSWVKGTK